VDQPSSNAERRSDPVQPAGVPRWVKILGVVVLVLVLLLIVLHLTGNSLGGPGSHLRSAEQRLLWP
jgi:hypothetical protein